MLTSLGSPSRAAPGGLEAEKMRPYVKPLGHTPKDRCCNYGPKGLCHGFSWRFGKAGGVVQPVKLDTAGKPCQSAKCSFFRKIIRGA